MYEEVSEAEEVVAFEGLQYFVEFAFGEDEVEELFVGPVIGFLYGLREILFAEVILEVGFDLSCAGMLDFLVARSQDVQVLSSYQDALGVVV
jgi:hypothetical protein